MEPLCGPQQPGSVPSPFDWWVLGALGTIGAVGAYVYSSGIPIINGIIALLKGSAVVLPSAPLLASFIGAAAVLALVFYYAFQADGCIISTPKGEPICFSGIVQETIDTSSTATAILAPFAIPPAGLFQVVVKSIYWNYVTQNSYWVYCSPVGAAMLPCLIKSKSACGGKIGSLVGAGVGAIAGIVLGFLAGAALGCAASGPFFIFCLLLACLIAVIVAAAITYAGAVVGGWIGQGIGSVGGDPVGDLWKGLERGTIVTVKGNWVTNKDVGNNELFYTTEIIRMGPADPKEAYSTADADATRPSDCPIAPDPIR